MIQLNSRAVAQSLRISFVHAKHKEYFLLSSLSNNNMVVCASSLDKHCAWAFRFFSMLKLVLVGMIIKTMPLISFIDSFFF